MADTQKIVEYKLTGDNTGLIKSVDAAIKQIDALEQKLNRVIAKSASARGDRVARIATAGKTTRGLTDIKTAIGMQPLSSFTPEQIALIQAATKDLNSLSKTISGTGATSRTTQEDLDNVATGVYKMQKAFNAAGLSVKQFDKAQKAEAQTSKREATEALRKQKAAWEEYASTVRSVARIMRTVATVIGNVWRVSRNLMSYAADFGETMNKFNVVVGESADVLREFDERMAETLGLDLQDLYEATATFKSVANSISLATNAAETFSKNLTMLAVDLASLYNTSNEQAINAITSALHGQEKAIKRYNIYLYKSNLQLTAQQHNITKSVDSMNEAEKVILRYISLLDQSKESQGDMARTLGSAANQLKIAQAQYAMLKRSLGQIVTVIMLTVIPAINAVVSGLSKVAQSIAATLGYSADLDNIASFFDDATTSTDEATDAVNSYASAVAGLTSLDEINTLSKTGTTSVLDPLTGGLAIDPAIKAALDKIQEYNNGMDKVKKSTGEAGDAIARTFENTILADAIGIAATAFKGLASAIGFVVDHWEVFEPFVKTGIDLLTIFASIGLAKKVMSWGTAIGSFAKKLQDFTAIILPRASTNLNGMLQETTTSVSGLTLAVGALGFALGKAIFTSFLDQFDEGTRKIIAGLGLIVSALTAAAAGWMLYHGVATAGVAVPIILTAAGIGVASIKGMMPKMATGGVVDDTTIAMIGEGHYSEAVVPLGNSPQFREMKESIASEVARKVSPYPLGPYGQQSGGTVVLEMDGREFARAILPYIGYTQKQVGVKFDV